MRTQPHRPGDDHGYQHTTTFDIETIVDIEPDDGSFPPWPRHRPVAAAFLKADWKPTGYEFELTTLISRPGEEGDFYQKVDALLPKGRTGISYNGRGFDLPVLQLQAMAAHRFDLEGLSNQASAHRFGRDHCDLADQFSLYGATKRVPLAELCDALGIPIKTSTDGSQVGALWRAGDVEAIARYVREDVIATYILWLFWTAARASAESRIAVALAELAVWIERQPELDHLQVFATCKPALWARSRVHVHKIQSALSIAERRALQAADERDFSA